MNNASNLKRLSGKVALISGGGSGIGRAVCRLFAEEGASVAIIDVSEAGGKETEKIIHEAGGNATFIKADVSKGDEVRDMVARVISTFKQINILHNNVGGWQREQNDTVTDDSEQEWDRLIGLNLRTAYLVSKEVIPHLIRAGGGAIINTITTNAYMNYAGNEAYGAGKGALKELTRAMCLDYANHNIRVNGLVPGETITPQWNATFDRLPNSQEAKDSLLRKIPAGRFARPEDIAKGALFLASEEASYVNGHILFVDGGLTAGFY